MEAREPGYFLRYAFLAVPIGGGSLLERFTVAREARVAFPWKRFAAPRAFVAAAREARYARFPPLYATNGGHACV